MTGSRRMVLILIAAFLAAVSARVSIRIKGARGSAPSPEKLPADDLLARHENHSAPVIGAIFDAGLYPRKDDFRDALNAVKLLPIDGAARPGYSIDAIVRGDDSLWILRVGESGKAGVAALKPLETGSEGGGRSDTSRSDIYLANATTRPPPTEKFPPRRGGNFSKPSPAGRASMSLEGGKQLPKNDDSSDLPSPRKSKNPAGISAQKSSHKRTPPLFHPIILSRPLGMDAIRPPRDRGSPPSFENREPGIPNETEDGTLINPARASLADIEKISPPETRALLDGGPEPEGFHPHRDGIFHYFHNGTAWVRWDGTYLMSFKLNADHWWLKSRHDSQEDQPPLSWHGSHWWWQTNGAWFLVHEGQPWQYRFMDEWQQEGLIHPASGTRMIYSADGSRVALVAPGRGAALYDAYTGRELAHWTQEQLPKRRQAKAPSALIFPRN